MRRFFVRSATALALAAITAAPVSAHAQELPTVPPLPRPHVNTAQIPQPQLPDLQDEIDRMEQNVYNALPKELQNNPVFGGSSRPQGSPQKQDKALTAKDAHNPAPRRQSVADETCSNCVAITYDDGPGNLTGQLLDTLKAKDAHASFMVLAPNAYAHPELLRRMTAEGHTVGNHTDSHRELTTLPAEQVDAEIKSGANAIKAATGQNPKWLRPPYGATNGTVDAAARANGQAQALWTVDTLDWKDRNAEHVCTAAVDGAQPGSIILMHDIHPTTVEASNCIIDGLRAKGLEPVNLDRLIPHTEAGRHYSNR